MNKDVFMVAKKGDTYEITINDYIGVASSNSAGYYSDDFLRAVADIPEDAEIKLVMNSYGGSLTETQMIISKLQAMKNNVTCYIAGVCMSCATLIACVCKKVVMEKGGLFVVHNPQCAREGDVRVMENAVKVLTSYKDYALSIYEKATKLAREKLSEMMDKETFMTAEEALENGFVHEIVDGVNGGYKMVCDDDFYMKVPENFRHFFTNNNKTNNITTMKENNEQSESVVAEAPIAENKGADLATMQALENKVAELEADRDRRIRSECEMLAEAAVNDGRIANTDKASWVDMLVKNEKAKAMLANLPKKPTVSPIAENSVVMPADETVDDVKVKFASDYVGADRSNAYNFLLAGKRYEKVGKAIAENAITIDDDLKQATIDTNTVVKAFFAPLRNVLDGVRTQIGTQRNGIDKVVISGIAKPSAEDVVDYNSSNGLVGTNGTVDAVEISLNKHKQAGLSWNLIDFTAQPFSSVNYLLEAKLSNLLRVVVSDVFSVVTKTNFPLCALGKSGENDVGVDVEDFTRHEVAVAKKNADKAFWTMLNRYLYLNSDYGAAVLEWTEKSTYAGMGAAGVGTAETGTFGATYGFNPIITPIIPANEEKLVGWISLRDAIGVVNAPVLNAEAIGRLQNATYATIRDPETGFTIGRQDTTDALHRTVDSVYEIKYGYGVLNNNALMRFVSES